MIFKCLANVELGELKLFITLFRRHAAYSGLKMLVFVLNVILYVLHFMFELRKFFNLQISLLHGLVCVLVYSIILF